jgi:hypothetical protein
MKIALVTANIGGFDKPKIPIQQSIECDFICFSENEIKGDNRHKAKYPKMMLHEVLPNYNAYVWIDSSVQIKSEGFVRHMIDCLQGYDVAIGKHNVRDCAFDECNFVINEINKGNEYLSKRYTIAEMNYVIEQLKAFQMPLHAGLYACGIFARINNEKVNRIFNLWWVNEKLNKTLDQPYFAYLAYKYLNVNKIEWNTLLDNQYFKLTPHND